MLAIAIDDEPIALDVVKSHAAKVPFIELKATFTNAFDALNYLRTNKVDLIFLDIKMPDISGIDFVGSLTDRPMVIFTTAYSEHAVRGFELDAVDYLLKPFSLSRFVKSCNKALDLKNLKGSPQSASQERDIFIKDGYEQIKVATGEILYIEACGNYTQLHLSSGKLLSTRAALNDMLIMLSEKNFVRIHRAYAVAKSKITKFDKNQVWIGDIILPIGGTYTLSADDLN